MMSKTLTACAAAAIIGVAVLAPQQADARGRGGAVAAGVIGGLAAGAIIGSAANGGYYGGPAYPAYGPGYYPAYGASPAYYGGACSWRRERFFDGYGWRSRRVRVCY